MEDRDRNMLLEEGWRKKFRLHALPRHMEDGTIRWICYGIKPGSFLWATVTNDLRDATLRADEENIHRLRDWMLFFQNDTPPGCWGGKTLATIWQQGGGLAKRLLDAKKEPEFHQTKMPGTQTRN